MEHHLERPGDLCKHGVMSTRFCEDCSAEHDAKPAEEFASPPSSREGTSEEAADQIAPNTGTIRRMVLDAIEEHGGMTCDEVEHFLELGHQTVSPRIWELQGNPKDKQVPRLIRDSGERRKTSSGRRAIVWEAV